VRAFAAATVVAVLIGCGGSQKTSPDPDPAPGPSAKQRACSRYGIRMAPFLRRLDTALDQFALRVEAAEDDTARADSARELSSFIDEEIVGLENIDSTDAELNRSHKLLVASLAEVGLASEQIATAYVLADRGVKLRALARRNDGLGHWSEAHRDIVTQCSEDADR